RDGIRDFHVTGVQTCALPIYEDQKKIVIRDENDNRIEMSSDGIVIESCKDIKLKAAADLKGEGVNVEMKGSGNFKGEGSGGAKKIGRASCRERGEVWWGAVS